MISSEGLSHSLEFTFMICPEASCHSHGTGKTKYRKETNIKGNRLGRF